MSNNKTGFPLSLPSVLQNPVVDTAISLHRKHPGEMVFLEVAAAGAFLYGHQKRKELREKYRQEADEDLRQRGWDSGAKARADSEHRSGMLSPPVPQQRPTSAPPPMSTPPPNWHGIGGHQRDDPLAYGYLPPPSHHQSPAHNSNLAYGTLPPEPYRPMNSAPPFQQSPPPYPPPQQNSYPYGPPSPYQQSWGAHQQPYPYSPAPPGQYPMQSPPPAPYGNPGYQQTYPPPGPYFPPGPN